MNIEHIKEIEVLENSLKFLRIFFLFPRKSEINDPKKNVYWKFILLSLSTAYFSIGAAIHLVVNVRSGAFVNVDKDVGTIISYYGALYFISRYLGNIKYIIILYKQFSDFKTYGLPNNFEKTNKLLNKFSKIYFVYHMFIVTGMTTSTLLTIGTCEEENLENNINDICGLVGPTWLPFEFDYFPLKQIVYGYQVYCSFVIFQLAGHLSYTLMESVEHLIIRFEHVGHTFVEALNEKNSYTRREKFYVAIQYHNDVIQMGKLLNSCFAPSLIVHISLTGPVLGVAGYRFLTEIPLDSTCLFFGWMFSTFIVCRGGQRLSEASLAVGDVIYRVNWYNLETDLQRDLKMVMLRSRKPVYLRAGPFGPMTYSTIVTILKTCYSYITLLKQTM
uniref:Odorant receptor n=1 Tax=Colaphellus bowringi TaxID=561076 RepID=A0A0S3J2Q3_9CUCU|nr:odorant receptor OR17 [Colaphellus bowringi]